jgi:hypothetical protein
MIEVVHTAKCPDRNGCPFDAHRCACWRMGCALSMLPDSAEVELIAWRAAHV